ncbi:hypothetical protein IWQ60_007902 [Tieghemiomyces parasiticus]|uniref:Uncharacterized protein n=1 Tax=Tieghemiomyces parasiticus TaxID=78921 RepID=A0A9W8A1B5_9FUNG|nr:hypothetical protein IWQ60_007902 [Tieghemiomyces parasiticus]
MSNSHAAIALVRDIAQTPAEWFGRQARVVGVLNDYIVADDLAVVEDTDGLLVDTKLLGDFGYHLGSTLMLIGEVEKLEDSSLLPETLRPHHSVAIPVLRARIIRCVDGIDLALYKTALEIRRDFEKTWSAASV